MGRKLLETLAALACAAGMVAVGSATAAPANQTSSQSLAQRFGALQNVMQLSLSPSGRKAA